MVISSLSTRLKLAVLREAREEPPDRVELKGAAKGGCPACGGYKGLCPHCGGKATYGGFKCPWGIIKTVGGKKVCYCKTCKGTGSFPLSMVPAPMALALIHMLRASA